MRPYRYLAIHLKLNKNVEYFLRGENGAWRSGTLGEMAMLNLTCAGHPISLCLDDLYEDLAP